MPALFQFVARARSRFAAQSRIRRELILFGIALLVGLLVIPWLVYLVGVKVLGEYASGGPFTLLGDYLVGLLHGSLVFWVVALGPYGFLILLRLLLLWIRSARTHTAANRAN